MKTLIVYHSRTGVTKKVAETIASLIKADIEEIHSKTNYKGPLGYLKAGKESSMKKLPEIEEVKKDPSDYDLVVIGTPIWAWTMESPIRSYLSKFSGHFQNVAFFCTMGGNGDEKAFLHMKEICGKEPKSTLTFKTKEVVNDFSEHIQKVKDFVQKIE